MLKQLIKPLAAGAVLMMCGGVAQAALTELAVNGGFETGTFAGWAQFPGSLGPAGQQISNVNPSSGSFSGRLTEPGTAASIIKQANLAPGLFTPGQQISISFDYRGTAAAGGVLFAELFSEILPEGTSSSVILGGGPLFPNANPLTWTSVAFVGVAGPNTSNGITVQFAAACAPIQGCISDYYIDNVSIKADVVPVPAAVWLFGSALGVVGVMRRKIAA